LQKIGASKSAKYQSEVRCNGRRKVLSNIKECVGQPRIYRPEKALEKNLNDRHPINVTNSNI